jgi:hypothetical protein
VLNFDDRAVDPLACTQNAAQFDSESFRQGIMSEIQAASATDSRPAGSHRQPLASTRFVKRAVRDPHR